MCLDMCMCVVRHTPSGCKCCARGVKHVQVGCCIVHQQVAHSVPVFRSLGVAHGKPWTHNSNNSYNYYNWSVKSILTSKWERESNTN